jgi:hypothetical protein
MDPWLNIWEIMDTMGDVSLDAPKEKRGCFSAQLIV